MDALLDMAKVTSKGQVTIPKDIRELLGVRTGDKILFTANGDGTVTMRNATADAFAKAREAFEGAAEEADLKSEEDVNEMIRQMRAERRAGR